MLVYSIPNLSDNFVDSSDLYGDLSLISNSLETHFENKTPP